MGIYWYLCVSRVATIFQARIVRGSPLRARWTQATINREPITRLLSLRYDLTIYVPTARTRYRWITDYNRIPMCLRAVLLG